MAAMTDAKIGREILEAAADLLSHPGAWAQGGGAFDSKGEPRVFDSPEACSWCLYGALWVEGSERGFSPHDEYIILLEDYLCDNGLTVRWNDAPERSQEEVVESLRRVAQDCEI